jgi:hypothetical protein
MNTWERTSPWLSRARSIWAGTPAMNWSSMAMTRLVLGIILMDMLSLV